MIALILAGGMGKRLKPITDNIPKALVPINGIPIILWQIKYFKKFGVDEFVICTGYKGDKIEEYVESENLGIKVHYSHEKEPLGTGGAIKNAAMFLKKDFFVINGDVITDIVPTSLMLKPFSIATINLKSQYGTLTISDDNITVDGFQEKGAIQDYWMNAGIYHLSQDIINELPEKGNIEDMTFPALAKRGLLSAIKYKNNFWHSIDSHKDIEECEKSMKEKNYNSFITIQ